MFGLNPYAIALKAAVVVAALLAGFTGGWKTESWRWGAAEAEVAKAAYANAMQDAEAINRAAAQDAQAQEKIRVVYRTIEKPVIQWRESPAGRAQCLDARGVQLGNAALRGEAADIGKPDATVPGTPGGSRDGAGGRAPR